MKYDVQRYRDVCCCNSEVSKGNCNNIISQIFITYKVIVKLPYCSLSSFPSDFSFKQRRNEPPGIQIQSFFLCKDFHSNFSQ